MLPFVSARLPGLSQCKCRLPGLVEQQQETMGGKPSQRQTRKRTKTVPAGARKNARGGGSAATKAERIAMLLRRTEGASLGEMMKATGWQQHSLRGFMSGTVVKRK